MNVTSPAFTRATSSSVSTRNDAIAPSSSVPCDAHPEDVQRGCAAESLAAHSQPHPGMSTSVSPPAAATAAAITEL